MDIRERFDKWCEANLVGPVLSTWPDKDASERTKNIMWITWQAAYDAGLLEGFRAASGEVEQ